LAATCPNGVIMCIFFISVPYVNDNMTSKSEEAFQNFKTSVKFDVGGYLKKKIF